jgi:hypothetical protein
MLKSFGTSRKKENGGDEQSVGSGSKCIRHALAAPPLTVIVRDLCWSVHIPAGTRSLEPDFLSSAATTDEPPPEVAAAVHDR